MRTVLSVFALLWSLIAIGSTSWAIAHDRYAQPVAPGLIALENLEHRLLESTESSESVTLSRVETVAAVEYAEKEMVARDRSTLAHLSTSVVLALLALAFLIRGRFEPTGGTSGGPASRSLGHSPSN
jgi:hypothetical protein